MPDGPNDMHDVPTHHGPSDPQLHEPSHEPPAWYATSADEMQQGAAHPHQHGAWLAAATGPAPQGSRKEPMWVIPVVAIACLVAAFSLVTMLLGRGDRQQATPTSGQITHLATSSSTSSSSSSSGSSDATSVSPSTSVTSTASSQTSSESSVSSASESLASFPAGTSMQCQTFDAETITGGDPDVQQTNGHTTSCEFLGDLRKSVWAHDGTSPGDSTYSLDVFSKVRLAKIKGSDGIVHLQCTPGHGLVHCVSREAEVDAWVRSQHS